MPDGSVLVTGAAGFIGSHLVEALVASGRRVVGVDNFDPFYPRARKERTATELRGLGTAFDLVEADITDAESVRAILGRVKPETVFHMAAKAGVRPSIADPAGYAHANVTGTSVILAEAHRAGVARVVAASSSSVYGNAPKVPFAEGDDVSRPISPYAATKRSCELLAHAHHHLTGGAVAMLRFFTVFGPRQRPDLAISLFLDRAARGEELTGFGDGTMRRDYTFVSDVVAGVLAAERAIDRHGYRVWNLGHDDPVSLRDMIAVVGRVVGKEPRVKWMPAQPGDVERTWADLARSRAELGYAPAVEFEEGVGRQWAWARRM